MEVCFFCFLLLFFGDFLFFKKKKNEKEEKKKSKERQCLAELVCWKRDCVRAGLSKDEGRPV